MADQILSPGFARVQNYLSTITALKAKYPNIKLPKYDTELEDYMRFHKYSRAEICEFLNISIKLFEGTMCSELPFVLNTNYFRENLPEAFAQLSPRAQAAKMLWALSDVAAWVYDRTTASVQNVLVPLSIFTNNPDAFRKTFIDEYKIRAKRGDFNPVRGLHPSLVSNWNCVSSLKGGALDEIGRWFEDTSQLAKLQGKRQNRVIYETLEVRRPEKCLPKFRQLKDIAKAAGYYTREHGMRRALYFGMARHDVEFQKDVKSKLNFYTGGILLGDERNWPDYAIGAVDLMTVTRAKRIFGTETLAQAPLYLTRDDYVWRDTGCPEPVLKEPVCRNLIRLMGLQDTSSTLP